MASRTLAVRAAAVALSACLPGVADAQTKSFTLNYTTFNDGVNAPATVSATLTALADPYEKSGFDVTSISGSRSVAATTTTAASTSSITGLEDPFSEFYYPATTLFGYNSPSFLDSFGITFSVGGTDYLIYRDLSDGSFYHEEQQNQSGINVGRLIQLSAFSIAPVTIAAAAPEPASWAMMVAGFAAAGLTLRRRPARPALA